MRIFKNKWFHRFAVRNDIDDDTLVGAIERADKGLIDADLGGGVLNSALPGKGRASQEVIAPLFFTGRKTRHFLCLVLQKAIRKICKKKEQEEYKAAAKLYLHLTEKQVSGMVEKGSLVEVKNDKKI